MISTKTAPTSIGETSLQDRISTALVFLYQLVALIALAIMPLLAVSWLRTPFIGVLLEHTMVTNGIGPRAAHTWNGYDQGLGEFGNQLIAIGNKPVRNAQELKAELNRYSVGDDVELTFLKLENNELIEVQVRLQKYPLADQMSLFYIPYLIGLFYLGCSLWVFSLRRNDVAGRAFVVFATSVGLAIGTLFDLYTGHRMTYLWSASLPLGGGGLFIMALTFPETVDLVRKQPYLRWLPLIPAGVLILLAIPTLYNMNEPTAYVSAWRYSYVFNGLAAFAFFGWTTFRYFTTQSPITREQSRIILLGSVVGFAPLGSWMILSPIFQLTFSPLLLVPMIAFPIATAYAILRYRLLDTDYFLSRAVLYAILATLSAAVYLLLSWGASLILGRVLPANNPLLVGLMVFILVAAFNPVRQLLQSRIDALFFRGQAIYQERLQSFSHALTRTIDLSEIIQLLRDSIEQNIGPNRTHIFLHDPLTDQYTATAGKDGKPSTDIRFSANSALALALSQEANPIFLGDSERLPAHLVPDRARLAILGAQLFVALPGQHQLTGWLALGPRKSGEPYTRRDLAFIVSLSQQAALAIERAQVVIDLERRVHEMNVLGRVAQGVNVTINFDDILELIYAQTNQVLRAQHFRITLYNDITRTFYHVFYLENDERLPEHENRSIPDGLGLEQEVVRSQRAIITDDYVRECRHRSYIPAMQGVYAWMGVPLNTGNETIGAISIGSSDPAVTYTRGQQNILQAIADQAAGAIVKTQLLQESERRARQLEILNQVSRSLTSTLDIDLLLNQILESAVGILNCEAGSLLLIDEETDELVFRVTVGPVAEDLTGTRLPRGAGLVGKAVETRQPIIDNNVHQSKDWFEKTDQETGFITRSLMVVPMQIRDEVIGVVEVLNKKDGTPFTPDDQQLLSAFTAQAAVSLQNARLFTMTDQALAARVEELSVMQRIDRELNASLDLHRAMRITLDWSMRQSGAEAGLVAITEEEGNLRVMAYEGYEMDFEDPQNIQKISQLPAIQKTLESSIAYRTDNGDASGISSLLPAAQGQLVVPIRRENKTIGIVFLESTQADVFDEETTAFLTRLSDHAAIAISNAQLYSAVEAANLAKSDFISFVSHELKTPMTSIRGFTDLLAAGAVGPVNEAQAGFLATIRSNVNRMASLVTDLADISRIEAGRLRLDFGAVSISEVIDEVVRSVKAQIDKKGQKLVVEIPDDLPAVWGDQTRLVQILLNLVSNANKYTPNNGTITIQAKRTQDGEDAAAPEVVQIAVKDTGIGIRPEDQKKIFTKFFRSDDPKAREASGTGLGLNITKNLVELQQGRIWFESEYRKGTTFYFTIPVAETG